MDGVRGVAGEIAVGEVFADGRVLSVAGVFAAGRVSVAGSWRAFQPGLWILSPDRVMIRYSTPGTCRASWMLSAGLITLRDVASAPASVAPGATTVALRIWSAGCPVRGSTIWEYQWPPMFSPRR